MGKIDSGLDPDFFRESAKIEDRIYRLEQALIRISAILQDLERRISDLE